MIHKIKIIKNYQGEFNETSEVIFMNKFDTDYLLDDDGIEISDTKTRQSTYSAYSIPGVVMENITYNTGKDITITGWIVDDPVASMSDKKKRLERFFNPKELFRLEFQDRYIDGYPTTTVKYGQKYKDNNDSFCKFMVTIFCPYPFFKSKYPIRVYPYIDPVPPLTDSDVDNPEPINGVIGVNGHRVSFDDQIAVVENPSDTDVGFSMYIRLAPSASISQVAGIGVYNETTGEYFAVKYNPLNGLYQLCTIPNEKGFWKLVDDKKESALTGFYAKSSFFSLAPGKNRISLGFPYYENEKPPQAPMWIKSLYFEIYPEYFYVTDEEE